jgi:hypothetical protein
METKPKTPATPDSSNFKDLESPISNFRRHSMPRKYFALYERATTGKSRKAAIRSFCLECCGYSSLEVRKCTDLGCPLYIFREEG